MIKAQHSKLAERLFSAYLNYLFGKHFYSVHLFDPIASIRPLPLVLIPNHSSWWDGFIIHMLNRKVLKRTTYLMMLEEQLAKNRLFAQVGAYSINPKSVTGVMETLNYTVDLINNGSNRMIVFFPQGKLQPWSVRPLGYKRGLEYLQKKCRNFQILQLGIKLEFLNEQRPQIFIKFGMPMDSQDPDLNITTLEDKHHQLLDDLQSDIIKGQNSLLLFRGRESINKRMEKLTFVDAG